MGRKRPLAWLDTDEFGALLEHLPSIRQAMSSLEDELDDTPDDVLEQEKQQRLVYGPTNYDRYWNVKRGRNMFNNHLRYRNHGLFKGRKVLPGAQTKWASRKA